MFKRKYMRVTTLFMSLAASLLLFSCANAVVAQAANVNARSRAASEQLPPLTYPQLITALNAKLPAGMTKSKLMQKLNVDVMTRGVDKPLTLDIEDVLRQAGATDRLIWLIKRYSPRP